MSMQIRCVCVDLDKWLCTTELAQWVCCIDRTIKVISTIFDVVLSVVYFSSNHSYNHMIQIFVYLLPLKNNSPQTQKVLYSRQIVLLLELFLQPHTMQLFVYLLPQITNHLKNVLVFHGWCSMAEFVVTELLSFAINIAFAFMFLLYIFDTLCCRRRLIKIWRYINLVYLAVSFCNCLVYLHSLHSQSSYSSISGSPIAITSLISKGWRIWWQYCI